MFNGEIIFYKKNTEKMVLLHYKWKTWYQVQGWKTLRTFLSCTKHPFVRHKILCKKTISYQCSRMIPRNEFKVFISPIENKLACFAIAKAHFRYPQSLCFFIVVHPNTKSLSQRGIAYEKLSTRFYNSFSAELVIFTDMNMNIFGRQEFKNILKRKLCNCMGQLLLIY